MANTKLTVIFNPASAGGKTGKKLSLIKSLLIRYFNNNREVIWEINRLPTSVTESLGKFEVSITPSEDDVDKVLVILSETQITALDKETQTQITKETKSLTTNLDDNTTSSGGGLIKGY